MSYILEALRRAQAERERQGVPGLQAQPYADLPVPAPRQRRAVLTWAAGLLLGALLLALLGWWAMPARRAPEAPPPVVERPAAPQPSPSPATAAPVARAGLPVVVSAPPVVSPQVSAAPMVAPVPAPVAAPPTAAAATSTVPRELRLAQLPAEQRRELPPLVIGGSVWSDNAASRFVILDGQLLREGDSVAPGLVLERMAPKAAWLRWRDLRIELAL